MLKIKTSADKNIAKTEIICSNKITSKLKTKKNILEENFIILLVMRREKPPKKLYF